MAVFPIPLLSGPHKIRIAIRVFACVSMACGTAYRYVWYSSSIANSAGPSRRLADMHLPDMMGWSMTNRYIQALNTVWGYLGSLDTSKRSNVV